MYMLRWSIECISFSSLLALCAWLGQLAERKESRGELAEQRMHLFLPPFSIRISHHTICHHCQDETTRSCTFKLASVLVDRSQGCYLRLQSILKAKPFQLFAHDTHQHPGILALLGQSHVGHHHTPNRFIPGYNCFQPFFYHCTKAIGCVAVSQDKDFKDFLQILSFWHLASVEKLKKISERLRVSVLKLHLATLALFAVVQPDHGCQDERSCS
mmetsp:Transcript_75694/g.133650  ORF Transcript_75694/g.133650 Transcript_75694/m.133650 type:complete len:214 (+) Transcript_75694:77-718(+)